MDEDQGFEFLIEKRLSEHGVGARLYTCTRTRRAGRGDKTDLIVSWNEQFK